MEFHFNLREIATASMVLFAVIDILGSIPIIIGLRNKVGHIQSEKASVVAACIMVAFLFLGEEILNLIGIDVNSFAVAGAFIIFFLAIEMILGISLYKDDEPESASILGKIGVSVIRKVFGVILMAIAVKLFTSNINQLF